MSTHPWLLLALWILLTLMPSNAWIVPQPKANMWVTLAQAIGQDYMCLSMANVKDPLSTCLVGIPLSPSDYPIPKRKPAPPSPLDQWHAWARTRPHAPEEPQELELLGSSPAPYCINFFYKGAKKGNYHIIKPSRIIYNSTNWCNYTTSTLSVSTDQPKMLQRGDFLTC